MTAATEQAVYKAREAYNKNPTPKMMSGIVLDMILGMAAVYEQAKEVSSDAPGAESWIEQFRNFQYRLGDYQQIVGAFMGEISYSEAAEYHKLPGGISDMPKAFNELLVRPILYGNAASSIAPDTWPYSKVGGMPDVATPIVLSQKLKKISRRADLPWTKRVVLSFLDDLEREGEGAISEKIEGLASVARMKLDAEMPALIEKAKEQIQKEAYTGAKKATAGPIALAIGLGGLALLASRKR